MNKRYIDFVPANNTGASKNKTVSKPVRKTTSGVTYRALPQRPQSERVVRPKRPDFDDRTIDRPVKRGLLTDENIELGVIEDLNTKFVSKEVEKRPLGSGRPVVKKNETDKVKEAKAKRLIGRKNRGIKAKEPVEKPVEKSVNVTEEKREKTFQMPKSPFINQEKVVKRPLSRNVYQKKVEAPREEQGPVTIISKPEKDGFAGRVIAIIIIIILGAAAGTVAFLLLPR